MKVFLDYETWSSVNITRGTEVYARHARPLILCWAVEDGPVQVHDYTQGELPKDISDILKYPKAILLAHNAWFDRMIMKHADSMDIPVEQWRCTMAQAQAHGLPGGLGPLGKALGLPQDKQKDYEGRRLIRKFCLHTKPYPDGTDPEWEDFIEYARQDVETMRDCYRKMPDWNYTGEELKLWFLDQKINERGFPVDKQLAEAAVIAIGESKGVLDQTTSDITGGEVTAATQRDKLLLWLCDTQGVILPDLRAKTIEDTLADGGLDDATAEMLRVRLESSKSSTSKFKRLIDSVGPDDRLRGTLNFDGASRTGRWAGRIFQPHNLPRPSMGSDIIDICINALIDGDAEFVNLIADSLPDAAANMLRGLIVAPPGRKLVVADWSNIEGRVLAWLAGEEWKLKAFRDVDAGVGHDLYKLTYANSFGIPVEEVTGEQRQIGKGEELGLGYGGGVNAFISMGVATGLDIEAMAKAVMEVTPEAEWKKTENTWEWALGKDITFGLSEETYRACEVVKRSYRRANAKIAKFWYMMDEAAKACVVTGDTKQVGYLTLDFDGKWMRIRLPSGRFLCYPLPKVHTGGTLTFMAYQNKQWRRTKTYGGKLVENVTQAVARDILAHALLELDAQGWELILHIHDEIIAEKDDKSHRRVADLKWMISIMTRNPKWARGLPLAAAGFETGRYRKG